MNMLSPAQPSFVDQEIDDQAACPKCGHVFPIEFADEQLSWWKPLIVFAAMVLFAAVTFWFMDFCMDYRQRSFSHYATDSLRIIGHFFGRLFS